jgi:lipoprotein-releasing system permease protein
VYRSFLSWRYLVSRPTNLIGIVGILVGVGALILILSIMTGFLEESRRTVRGTLSDLVISPLHGERTATGTVPMDPHRLLAVVRADPRVAAATPQLVWGAVITTREGGKGLERMFSGFSSTGLPVAQLVGIDVAGFARAGQMPLAAAVRAIGGFLPRRAVQDELDATDFLRSVAGDGTEEGRWTLEPPHPLFPFAVPAQKEPGRPRAGVLVGEQLYESFRMRRGQVIELGTMVRDPADGEWRPNNREYVVAGTFRTRDNETDGGRIYLDRRELADFLGGTHEYTQVLVRTHDFERHGDALAWDLRAELAERGLIAAYDGGGYEVRTWEEFRGNLLGAIENERVLMGIMLSLVLVVAGFTIFAILSMMVTEKRRDIGILSALGATPRGVLQMFLMIAFWDALLGGVAGAVLGTWGAIEIDAFERWLSRTLGIEIFDRSVYLFDHIPSVVQPLWVGRIVLGAFLCALVFAALPAWRAARLDPLEALRYE